MKQLYLAGALALAPLTAAASCGSAFCTINTSWDAHSGWLEPGARFDLRYEYIQQDQPRSGTRSVAVGEIPRDHDEIKTINRNLFGTFDYTFNQDWGVNVLLPIVDRYHQHFDHDEGELQTWRFTELGDIRVMGRRRLSTSENTDSHTIGTSGVNFGLKLPTGKTDVANAEGERAERSLQPGTGTTDAVLGAYHSHQIPLKNFSWFAQALVQLPMNSHEDFKPGRRFQLDAGGRYAVGDKLGLLLQANTLFKGRDTGAHADNEDSGGKFVFLSPGVSYAFTPKGQAYAFFQAPIYQSVNGVQLGVHYAAVVGLNFRF